MEYAVGTVLGLALGAFGTVVGFDRDRAFAPTALIVIAAYYVLFAAMAGNQRVVVAELVGFTFFSVLATVGFRTDLRLAAAGIVGHGLFDGIHHRLVTNPGMPGWWPGFCMTIDVVFGAWLALRLRTSAAPPPPIAR